MDDDTTVTTQDVDIEAFESIKIAIGDKVDPALTNMLQDLRFSPVPNLDCKHKPTQWTVQVGGTMVNFLTPKSSDVLMFGSPRVYAQALPFLNFLIAKPILAVGLYRGGVLVQIPTPERYAIHKLIVAQRRTGNLLTKSRKDFAQARNLIRILSEDRPYTLREAYETAMSIGPEWRDEIEKSFSQHPDIAKMMEGLQ